MINQIKTILGIFKNDSYDRSQKANLNIVLSIFFRGASILLSFALIPMTLDYIEGDRYGVWLTLSSLVGWIGIFDIGIGNGLRNRLSESLADGDYILSKIYVTTTYVLITLIAFALLAIYVLIAPFLNWQSIFNSNFVPESELNLVVSIVVICFLLKFIADIINVVASAYQLVSISSILLFIGNIGLTLGVWILTQTTDSSLILLAICLSVVPFLVSVAANLYLFATKFRDVIPSRQYLDFKKSKGILSLGTQFFILQIITLIIFQTDNILIAQLFRPADVTDFNILYKYYSIITIIFTIILTPYWTAFTEAHHKKEYEWIRKTMKRLVLFWGLSILVLLVMVLCSDFIIHLWVGNTVSVSLPLSISISLYIAVFNWNAIFSSFLNGIGKIRLQIILAVFAGLINIPLCYLFVKYFHFGVYAMPLSNFISLILGGLFAYLQYAKIIGNTAQGIWNR